MYWKTTNPAIMKWSLLGVWSYISGWFVWKYDRSFLHRGSPNAGTTILLSRNSKMGVNYVVILLSYIRYYKNVSLHNCFWTFDASVIALTHQPLLQIRNALSIDLTDWTSGQDPTPFCEEGALFSSFVPRTGLSTSQSSMPFSFMAFWNEN